MIDWVFLDVGNVLFDDDPQQFEIHYHFFEAMRSVRPGYDFAQLLADREQLAAQGNPFVLHTLASRMLSEPVIVRLYQQLRERLLPRYDQVNLLSRAAREVVQQLRQHYRLGIIANQPAECRASLVRRGLNEFFDVIAISEEIDLHKPDPQIYQWALLRAGSSSERAVMIGDRRDNDVEPARSLGMRTIWLDWSPTSDKAWNVTNPDAVAFLKSCARVPIFHSLPTAQNAPDLRVGALSEIPQALAALQDR